MTKKRMRLDRMQVPTPCPADWDLMPGDDLVRFCRECNRNVYHISAMRRPEAEALVANSDGQICVRFYREIDGTIRTEDTTRPPLLRVANASRFVSATLAGLLALNVASYAEASAAPDTPTRISRAYGEGQAEPHEKAQSSQATLSGAVLDGNKAVIVGATIRITNRSTGQTKSVLSSEEGFAFRGTESGEYLLDVEALGFVLFEKRINLKRNSPVRLRLVLKLADVGPIMGGALFPASSIGPVDPGQVPPSLLRPIKPIKHL